MCRPAQYDAPVLIAATFYDFVLTLHILAVVIAFGATFAYPVFLAAITKADPRALPSLYRAFHAVSQRVIMPGLALVVICGIYLASKLHVWSDFFVQWGIGVAIVIGAIEGMYLGPRERRLVEAADRDLAAAGDGPLTSGPEHQALARNIGAVGALMDLLVILTIFFMVARTGA
jgi:hypothetical protein